MSEGYSGAGSEAPNGTAGTTTTTAAAAAAPARRRKWDVADPAAVASGLVPPNPSQPALSAYGQYVGVAGGVAKQPPVQLSTEEAQLRATALLAAKAIKPVAPAIPQGPPPSEYTAELGINHVRADIRLHLTTKATHEDILRETGAHVIVRGVYCAPGEAPPPGEKPIHLLITADTNEKMESAKRKITEMMKSQSPLTSNGNLVWKVVIPIENPEPAFGLIGKVLGPKGQYVKHIEQDARVRVQLRGRGAHREGGDTRPYDNEPTHLFIQASTGESLEKAKSLAQNLVDHIKTDYDKYIANKNAPPPPPPPQAGPAPPSGPRPPPGPPPSAPRPPTSSYRPAPPPPQSSQPPSSAGYPQQQYSQQNAYAAYYGAYPGYDYAQYYQAYYGAAGYSYDANAAYYQQQHAAAQAPQAAAPPPPPPAAPAPHPPQDLTDSRNIKRNRDEIGETHGHSEHQHGAENPASKRQKLADESPSSLVSYEATEEERQQMQKPFWAAKTNEPPPTAFIGGSQSDTTKSKDYDQLHQDLMRELGK